MPSFLFKKALVILFTVCLKKGGGDGGAGCIWLITLRILQKTFRFEHGKFVFLLRHPVSDAKQSCLYRYVV